MCNAGDAKEDPGLMQRHRTVHPETPCCKAYHVGCAAFRPQALERPYLEIVKKNPSQVFFFPGTEEADESNNGAAETKESAAYIYCNQHLGQIKVRRKRSAH